MAARADKLFSPSLTKTASIFVRDEVLAKDSYQEYYDQHNLLPTLNISLDNSDAGYTVIMPRRTTRIPPCAAKFDGLGSVPAGVSLGHLGDKSVPDSSHDWTPNPFSIRNEGKSK